jgi:tetratricopeptide (TPR) repeat protein
MIANFIFLLFITRFTSVLIFTLAGIAGFSYFAYHSIRYLLHNRNAEHIVAMHYVWLHYKAHQAKQFEQAAAAAQKAFEHNCQWVPTWITAARFHEQYGFTSDQAREFLEKANLLIKSNKDNSQNLEYLESYEDTFGTLEARQENLLEAIEHLKAAQQYKSNPNREQCIKKLESLLYPDEYKPDSDN